MKPLVYLAGPIAGLTYDEGQDWRDMIKEELTPSIICASPLRSKEFLRSEGVLGNAGYDHPLASDKGIMTRDHYDCMRADVILCNFLDSDKVSIGTVMECAWAFAYRKPLVVIMEKSNVHNHPMIREAAGYIVDNFEDAVQLIRTIVYPRGE